MLKRESLVFRLQVFDPKFVHSNNRVGGSPPNEIVAIIRVLGQSAKLTAQSLAIVWYGPSEGATALCLPPPSPAPLPFPRLRQDGRWYVRVRTESSCGRGGGSTV